MLAEAQVKNLQVFIDDQPLTRANLEKQPARIKQLVTQTKISLFKSAVEWDEAAIGCDGFVGLSHSPAINSRFIKNMNGDPWIFALSFPKPNITFLASKTTKALIYCTALAGGQNQINALTSLPGLVKALQAEQITTLTPALKIRAAYGVANCINPNKIKSRKILPHFTNRKVSEHIYFEIIKTAEEKAVVG